MTVALNRLIGRIGDVDAHENIPTSRYPEFFGEAGRRFLELNKPMFDWLELALAKDDNRITLNRQDDETITEQTVWEKKGVGAPAHADMDRRPQVLDVMGIKRQLVFPGFGLMAMSQAL